MLTMMNIKIPYIGMLSAVVALSCVTGHAQGFGDRLRRAAETAKKATERVPEASKEQAAQPAPRPQPAPASASAAKPTASNPSEELWPNLAVDEARIARIQAAFQADCEASRGPSRGMNCACIAERFPQQRLQNLSTEIRRAEKTGNFFDPQAFERLTTSQGQIDFHTPSDPVLSEARGAVIPEKEVLKTIFNIYYQVLPALCKDGSVLAQRRSQLPGDSSERSRRSDGLLRVCQRPLPQGL